MESFRFHSSLIILFFHQTKYVIVVIDGGNSIILLKKGSKRFSIEKLKDLKKLKAFILYLYFLFVCLLEKYLSLRLSVEAPTLNSLERNILNKHGNLMRFY